MAQRSRFGPPQHLSTESGKADLPRSRTACLP